VNRFREISIQVEDVLGSGLELSATGFSNSAVFKFPASRTIMAAIQRCWADDIFIYGLSHRFWKLTLQVTIQIRAEFQHDLIILIYDN